MALTDTDDTDELIRQAEASSAAQRAITPPPVASTPAPVEDDTDALIRQAESGAQPSASVSFTPAPAGTAGGEAVAPVASAAPVGARVDERDLPPPALSADTSTPAGRAVGGGLERLSALGEFATGAARRLHGATFGVGGSLLGELGNVASPPDVVQPGPRLAGTPSAPGSQRLAALKGLGGELAGLAPLAAAVAFPPVAPLMAAGAVPALDQLRQAETPGQAGEALADVTTAALPLAGVGAVNAPFGRAARLNRLLAERAARPAPAPSTPIEFVPQEHVTYPEPTTARLGERAKAIDVDAVRARLAGNEYDVQPGRAAGVSGRPRGPSVREQLAEVQRGANETPEAFQARLAKIEQKLQARAQRVEQRVQNAAVRAAERASQKRGRELERKGKDLIDVLEERTTGTSSLGYSGPVEGDVITTKPKSVIDQTTRINPLPPDLELAAIARRSGLDLYGTEGEAAKPALAGVNRSNIVGISSALGEEPPPAASPATPRASKKLAGLGGQFAQLIDTLEALRNTTPTRTQVMRARPRVGPPKAAAGEAATTPSTMPVAEGRAAPPGGFRVLEPVKTETQLKDVPLKSEAEFHRSREGEARTDRSWLHRSGITARIMEDRIASHVQTKSIVEKLGFSEEELGRMIEDAKGHPVETLIPQKLIEGEALTSAEQAAYTRNKARIDKVTDAIRQLGQEMDAAGFNVRSRQNYIKHSPDPYGSQLRAGKPGEPTGRLSVDTAIDELMESFQEQRHGTESKLSGPETLQAMIRDAVNHQSRRKAVADLVALRDTIGATNSADARVQLINEAIEHNLLGKPIEAELTARSMGHEKILARAGEIKPGATFKGDGTIGFRGEFEIGKATGVGEGADAAFNVKVNGQDVPFPLSKRDLLAMKYGREVMNPSRRSAVLRVLKDVGSIALLGWQNQMRGDSSMMRAAVDNLVRLKGYNSVRDLVSATGELMTSRGRSIALREMEEAGFHHRDAPGRAKAPLGQRTYEAAVRGLTYGPALPDAVATPVTWVATRNMLKRANPGWPRVKLMTETAMRVAQQTDVLNSALKAPLASDWTLSTLGWMRQATNRAIDSVKADLSSGETKRVGRALVRIGLPTAIWAEYYRQNGNDPKLALADIMLAAQLRVAYTPISLYGALFHKADQAVRYFTDDQLSIDPRRWAEPARKED